jgi:hypothetical protein
MMQKAMQKSSEPATSALRIRFVGEPPANTEVFCKFADPRTMVAVGEAAAVDSSDRGDTDRIDIISTSNTQQSAQDFQSWIGSDTPPVVIKTDAGTVRWRAGRAVVQASAGDCKALLPAVIEFAFYEGELRKLEQAVAPFEATADADVSHAYEMTPKHRRHWDRLYRTMEQLYRLRLQFARLEPHLHRPSATLPSEARRLFARLASKAQVADRLEAISDRLETCEDLYEGACDRITDYKAYRKGNWLEIAIVILLAAETILLLVQGHLGR